MSIVQVMKTIRIQVLSGKDVQVKVSGDNLSGGSRILTDFDEMNITYEVLVEASDTVEAAIAGAMALEEK